MAQPTLVQEFIEAIKNSAAKLTTYQESCKKFTDDTRAHAEELSKLIDRLAACIKEIEALQAEYNTFLAQLTQIQNTIVILIKKARQDAIKDSDKECDKKIQQIRSEFTALFEMIKNLKLNTKSGMRQQLDRLKAVIEKLCGEGDTLVNKMRGTKGRLGSKVDEMTSVISQYNVRPESPMVSPRRERRRPVTRTQTQSRQHSSGRETLSICNPVFGESDRRKAARERQCRAAGGVPRGGRRSTRKRRGGFRYGKDLQSISKSRRRTRSSHKRSKRSQSKSRSSKSKRTRRRSKRRTR